MSSLAEKHGRISGGKYFCGATVALRSWIVKASKIDLIQNQLMIS